MRIQIKGKLWTVGNGYVVTIPKAVVHGLGLRPGDILSGEIGLALEKAIATPTQRNAPTGKSTPLLDDHTVEVYTPTGVLIARLSENQPSPSSPKETRAGGSALLYTQRCAQEPML